MSEKPYLVRLRLKDTEWPFATEQERDSWYAELLGLGEQLNLPEEHAFLSRIDTHVSNFTGKIEEKRVE